MFDWLFKKEQTLEEVAQNWHIKAEEIIHIRHLIRRLKELNILVPIDNEYIESLLTCAESTWVLVDKTLKKQDVPEMARQTMWLMCASIVCHIEEILEIIYLYEEDHPDLKLFNQDMECPHDTVLGKITKIIEDSGYRQ